MRLKNLQKFFLFITIVGGINYLSWGIFKQGILTLPAWIIDLFISGILQKDFNGSTQFLYFTIGISAIFTAFYYFCPNKDRKKEKGHKNTLLMRLYRYIHKKKKYKIHWDKIDKYKGPPIHKL